jgi:hypothetical protein
MLFTCHSLTLTISPSPTIDSLLKMLSLSPKKFRIAVEKWLPQIQIALRFREKWGITLIGLSPSWWTHTSRRAWCTLNPQMMSAEMHSRNLWLPKAAIYTSTRPSKNDVCCYVAGLLDFRRKFRRILHSACAIPVASRGSRVMNFVALDFVPEGGREMGKELDDSLRDICCSIPPTSWRCSS